MASVGTPVVAIFSDYQGKNPVKKSLLLAVYAEQPDVVHLVGGPTGYESFYISEWYPGNWEACMGDSIRQKCVIEEAEMVSAMGRIVGMKMVIELEKLNGSSS